MAEVGVFRKGGAGMAWGADHGQWEAGARLPRLVVMTMMTILTIGGQHMTNTAAWTVAEAKAKFSRVIEQAHTAPQTITRNGRPAAVVVSPEEWERRTSRVGSLVDFLAASPLRGTGLDVERDKDPPRDSEL
jgi:prevent-host-death family protein